MLVVAIVLVVANLAVSALLWQRRGGESGATARALEGVRADNLAAAKDVREKLDLGQKLMAEQLEASRKAMAEGLREERREINERLDRFASTLTDTGALLRKEASESRSALEQSLSASLATVAKALGEFRESTQNQLTAIGDKVEKELTQVRTSNEVKLDEMRETVDEKLHGTLEKRLGESFQQVSASLEAVHKGLGEMQLLATGVGDLKRVLSNVKARGVWGEVQLGRQLEDILTPDQYEENVAVKPESRERVEFAIKLPGRDGGVQVYLPIDAKFPQEDYERLVSAQDAGEVDLFNAASAQLEKAIRLQAKTIADKYVHPPYTTDFAIMYLPTEGLFAEVIRRPGLVAELQREMRVLVTGPTTLMAILNSLQMGFRTLAIEKSSSEVWGVLAKAKSEFVKYAVVWEKLEKQLGTAHTTAGEIGKRSRAVERSLREVQEVGPAASSAVDALLAFTPEDDDAESDDAGADPS